MFRLNTNGSIGRVSTGARFISLFNRGDLGIMREGDVGAHWSLIWIVVVGTRIHVGIGNT